MNLIPHSDFQKKKSRKEENPKEEFKMTTVCFKDKNGRKIAVNKKDLPKGGKKLSALSVRIASITKGGAE